MTASMLKEIYELDLDMGLDAWDSETLFLNPSDRNTCSKAGRVLLHVPQNSPDIDHHTLQYTPVTYVMCRASIKKMHESGLIDELQWRGLDFIASRINRMQLPRVNNTCPNGIFLADYDKIVAGKCAKSALYPEYAMPTKDQRFYLMMILRTLDQACSEVRSYGRVELKYLRGGYSINHLMHNVHLTVSKFHTLKRELKKHYLKGVFGRGSHGEMACADSLHKKGWLFGREVSLKELGSKNSELGRYRFDFVIEREKLIIEIDGEHHRIDVAHHKSSAAERQRIDAIKDAEARLLGYRVKRIKYNSGDTKGIERIIANL